MMEQTIGVYTIPGSGSTLPAFSTGGSACFDICARLRIGQSVTAYDANNTKTLLSHDGSKFYIYGGMRVLVPTGLILDIPQGYSVRLHARSGLSLKQGLVLTNSEGVIDCDYTDELFVMMHCLTSGVLTVNHGDRICQGELVRNQPTRFVSIPNPPQPKTDRAGGFGSTGVST